ncbi:hypothetical protein FKM82_029602 [Ascaphus truei]
MSTVSPLFLQRVEEVRPAIHLSKEVDAGSHIRPPSSPIFQVPESVLPLHVHTLQVLVSCHRQPLLKIKHLLPEGLDPPAGTFCVLLTHEAPMNLARVPPLI